jgi:hypothetical protein
VEGEELESNILHLRGSRHQTKEGVGCLSWRPPDPVADAQTSWNWQESESLPLSIKGDNLAYRLSVAQAIEALVDLVERKSVGE